MSEMIERVARAIYGEDTLDGLGSDVQARMMDRARLAIKAMREPTPPMLDRFVSRALCVSVHGEGGWSDYARKQWQTMLDGALD